MTVSDRASRSRASYCAQMVRPAPSMSFLDDQTTGFYRNGSSIVTSIGGGAVATTSATGITVAGSITWGTSAMTAGALSCTSLTSSGTISCGANSMTCGALSSTSLAIGTGGTPSVK